MTDKFAVHDNRKHGFFMVYNEIVRRDGALLGPHAIAVYCLLASYAGNEDRAAFPSINTMATTLGMSKTTVRKAIKALTDRGWIDKEKRKISGSNGYHSNVYRLLDIPDAAPVPGTADDPGGDTGGGSADGPPSPADTPPDTADGPRGTADDPGGGSGDDPELDSYSDQDSTEKDSEELNPLKNTPLPPAGAVGVPDGTQPEADQSAVSDDSADSSKAKNEDGLFEFVLMTVYGIRYERGQKLSKGVRGHTNGIAGALRDVQANPKECAAALTWHSNGRGDRRRKLEKPQGAPQWAAMIAAYREKQSPNGCLSSDTEEVRSRFVSGQYADIIES